MSIAIPAAPDRRYGPVTRTDIVRYQGASGDFNPIHHDDDNARAVGYPMAFAPGMLQAGLLASYATDWLGTRNIRRFTVRFHDQVWPGDTLRFSGRVLEVGNGEVTVALECHRDDDIVVSGSARFITDATEGEGR